MSSLPRLVILVPVYREHAWLESGFDGTWSWLGELPAELADGLELRFCVWVDSPSDEDHAEALRRRLSLLSPKLNWSITRGTGERPSVAASLKLALEGRDNPLPSDSHILVCPIDCSPTAEGLRELRTATLGGYQGFCVFRKFYADCEGSFAIGLSTWLQNELFSPLFGLHCWTHLFVVPTAVLKEELQTTGFLEDLSLNKALIKRLGRPLRLRTRAQISARRYAKRGPAKQILSNVFIFASYLRGKSSRDSLRSIHES